MRAGLREPPPFHYMNVVHWASSNFLKSLNNDHTRVFWLTYNILQCALGTESSIGDNSVMTLLFSLTLARTFGITFLGRAVLTSIHFGI